MWLSCIKKGEENLLKMIKEKSITGKDIKLIADVFVPLIDELKIKNVERNKTDDKDKKEKEWKGNISPGWKEVASFSRETFYFDAETVVTKSKVPEMGVSDLPFSDFKGKPSSLDVFQRMESDFYEPLDKAFESASFDDIDNIRKVSQERAIKLEEDKTLGQLGMSKEEAEVLFSYTYEAKKGKTTPCYIMNKILADHDDNKLRGHRGYILHLLKALRRLKPVLAAGTTLYRGIDGKFLKFDEEHYKVGNILTWPAFTSTTIKEDVSYKFMERAEQPIIFEINGAFIGYNIKPFSRYPEEEEILLEPETTFKVVSIKDDTINQKAKRIIIEVKKTPLMIKEAVENFWKTEWCLQHPGQQQDNKERLPPGWMEVVSPSGGTFYLNTKTGISLSETPEMSMSDLPFSVFMGRPPALDIFQRMKCDFYKPLDKAFESASFDDIDDIKRESQEKAVKLEMNGTLRQLGMSKEEAEVLFSYTYEAKEAKKAPYYIINKILADRDDNKIKKYRGYILHLLKALRRLKPIPTTETTLYRGIDGKLIKFDKEHYKVGNILTWPAFTSTTVKEKIVYENVERVAQPTIFEIHGYFVGYDIKPFSKYPEEEEILLEPETTFRVVSIQDDAKNLKVKRIIVNVQPTPLMIREAVENFARTERNLQHSQQQMNYNNNNNLNQSFNQQ